MPDGKYNPLPLQVILFPSYPANFKDLIPNYAYRKSILSIMVKYTVESILSMQDNTEFAQSFTEGVNFERRRRRRR